MVNKSINWRTLWDTNNSDLGTSSNILSVSDGLVRIEAFSLTVKDSNDDPTISGTPDDEVDEDAIMNLYLRLRMLMLKIHCFLMC